MPELPRAMAARFQRDYGLPAYDAAMMTQSQAFARYFEAARDACGQPKLVGQLADGRGVAPPERRRTRASTPARSAPPTLAALIARIADGTISNNGARQVFEALWTGEGAATSTR